MKLLKVLIFFVLLITLVIAEEKVSYRNAKYLEFEVKNEKQLKAVQMLEIDSSFVFLEPAELIGIKAELIVKPELFNEFLEFATENEIEFKVLTDDIQSWFDDELPSQKSKAGFGFDRYNSFEEILTFLNETHQQFPTVTELFTIGKSFEGHELKGIKITKNENNPIIFIDANIHAREWIASASAVWVINEILTNSNPTIRAVLDELTIYVMPMANPDGYIYSYDINRLWRKTRSTHSSVLCVGVDPNRNFAYNWMVGTGGSSVPCTDTYSGTHPFSEPETKALNEFYGSIHENVVMYISLHSAVQMLLFPWGHTQTYENIHNKDDLDQVSQAGVTAIYERYNTTYTFGSANNLISATAGTSRDHFYGFYHTPISYTIEMRRAAVGDRWVLPPQEIIPASEELFDGLIAMIKKAKELGYY